MQLLKISPDPKDRKNQWGAGRLRNHGDKHSCYGTQSGGITGCWGFMVWEKRHRTKHAKRGMKRCATSEQNKTMQLVPQKASVTGPGIEQTFIQQSSKKWVITLVLYHRNQSYDTHPNQVLPPWTKIKYSMQKFVTTVITKSKVAGSSIHIP